jgi:beta-lactamase superfamily II metal-dependent hydrolase
VACLNQGAKVKVVNTISFWREITFGDNKRGWVARKYLAPVTAPTPTDADSIDIPADAVLTVHFIDVGQGDAIWIQTHDDKIDGNGIFEGYSIVIDGGPYSADNNNPVRSYLEKAAYHDAPIEALILTHPHDDHYSGAEAISRHFAINHYYDPGYPKTSVSYQSFLSALRGEGGKPPRAKKMHIGKSNFGKMDWGAELKVEVLYSWTGDPQNVLGSGNTEENNASIVLRVQYGEHVFLFMGDAEGKDRTDDAAVPKYVEKILLETVSSKLKSTVLKIAHHGSETSSTLPFIEAVDPEIVVVQSGRKKFKTTFLPDVSTLQRYCAQNVNVKIYRTDQGDTGADVRKAVDNDHIVIRTNGKGKPKVEALNGGKPVNTNFCNNTISLNE